jgi:hypothetical protein
MGLNVAQLNEISEKAARMAEAAQGNKSGNQDFLKNFVRMPDGIGWVDVHICPPADDCPHSIFGGGLVMPSRLHKLGINGIKGSERSYHCRRVLNLENDKWYPPENAEDCAPCQWYAHLWQTSLNQRDEKQKQTQDRARTFRPHPRFYYNAIEVARSDGDADSEAPKILSVGKTIGDMILDAIGGKKGDVTSFEKDGRLLRIEKKMKGQGKDAWPEYTSSDWHDPAPFGTPEQRKSWMANLHDLHSLRKLLSGEELAEKLQIHNGVKKPEDGTNFDPTEFEMPSEDTSVSVSVPAGVPEEPKEEPKVEAKKEEPKEEKVEEVTVAESAESSQDEFLADDDFLNELKNMED